MTSLTSSHRSRCPQLERDEDFGETSAAALLFMAREYAAENLAHMVQDAPPEPKLSNAMASSTPVGRRGYTLPSAWEEAVAGWLGWLRLQGVRDTTLRTRRGQVRVIARQSRTQHPCEIDLAMLVRSCGRPGSQSITVMASGRRWAVSTSGASTAAWCRRPPQRCYRKSRQASHAHGRRPTRFGLTCWPQHARGKP